MRMGRSWTGIACLLVGSLLSACVPAPTDEDGGELDPLHGDITPDMLAAPEAQSNAAEIAALEATQGVWRSEGVIDGQTLLLVSEGDSVRLRLAGVTVPTGDECLADIATDSLRFIVGGQRPLSLDAALDPGSGEVQTGYVETIDGDDLGGVLLRLGLADIDPATLNDDYRAGYEAELEAAKAEQANLWDDDLCPG